MCGICIVAASGEPGNALEGSWSGNTQLLDFYRIPVSDATADRQSGPGVDKLFLQGAAGEIESCTDKDNHL